MLKKACKVWFCYCGITWMVNAASKSALNVVDYTCRKESGDIKNGEKLQFKWTWAETFDNLKKIYKKIDEFYD